MVEDHFETMVSSDIITNPLSLVLIHDVGFEGILRNITKTILIDILVKLGILENINVGQNSPPS